MLPVVPLPLDAHLHLAFYDPLPLLAYISHGNLDQGSSGGKANTPDHPSQCSNLLLYDGNASRVNVVTPKNGDISLDLLTLCNMPVQFQLHTIHPRPLLFYSLGVPIN